RALAVSLRVDQAGIDLPEVVEGDAQALAGVGQEVGQEHVGANHEPAEEVAPGVVGEVDPDAPLVPADLLDDEVAPRGSRDMPPGWARATPGTTTTTASRPSTWTASARRSRRSSPGRSSSASPSSSAIDSATT